MMRQCERCKVSSHNVYQIRQPRGDRYAVTVCFNCVGEQLRYLYHQYGVVNATVKTFNAPGVK